MSELPAEAAGTTLIHNVLVFGRLLRSAGFPMSAGREMELLRALELIDLGDRARVYQACRAMLVTKRDQVAIFDRAFALFFGRPGGARRRAAHAAWSARRAAATGTCAGSCAACRRRRASRSTSPTASGS